ncbi:restriction endonuclease subunit S [Prosthecobacter sp.]|uniref:restriction endonuclease subunit S n=1 Tax=Prosthecobacter sp. TaxID=1965333 RepID=UPI003783D8AD
MSKLDKLEPAFLGDLAFESKVRASDVPDAGLRVYGVDRTDGLTPDAKYTSKELSRYKVLRPGMFAYNPMRLNIGSIAACTEKHAIGLVSPDYVVFGCKPDALDPAFLGYAIKGPEWRQWTTAAGVGSVRVRIYFRELARMPMTVPPLAEQKAIASVLGALDDKIELNRRMNATLESMARALFQSWFVDFDPVRAKQSGQGFNSPRRKGEAKGFESPDLHLFPDSFQDSDLGPIPTGWEISKLKNLTSKIGSGATPRGGSEVYVEEGIAFIRSQNVYDHEFHWSGLARLTDKSADELRNVEVMKNDVLLNITGDSILRTCVVDPSVLPARVNQHVAIIRAIKGIPPRYLHLYLVQPAIKSLLIGMSAGATRHAITKGHLESMDVLLPPSDVLEAFEKIVTPWFDQIDLNRIQSRTLATLRDTLLPKLLSGELNLTKSTPTI